MQESEEFCRKIDSKLRRCVISTFVVIFAAACAASVFMYFFAPNDDLFFSLLSNASNKTGSEGEFMMDMSQSGQDYSFSVVSSELSGDVFTTAIRVENFGNVDIVLSPDDFRFFSTNADIGSRPHLCRTDISENVVILAGQTVDFSVSVIVPEDFSFETCRISAVISIGERGENIGLMLY